jgi:cell wall-associated NlpC family hydrolase
MMIRASIIIFTILFSCISQAEEITADLRPSDPIGISQVVMKSMPAAVQNLLQYALSNEGVVYHKGGTTPENGFDCSGFVRYVFDHVQGVTLPHSAQALSQIGDRIKTTDLLPGDLVFFRFMRSTISHVGIYLGNNEFIHASSTRTGSVVISNLTDSYWAKHFALVRRLDFPTVESPIQSDRLPPSSTFHLESTLPSLSNN